MNQPCTDIPTRKRMSLQLSTSSPLSSPLSSPTSPPPTPLPRQVKTGSQTGAVARAIEKFQKNAGVSHGSNPKMAQERKSEEKKSEEIESHINIPQMPRHSQYGPPSEAPPPIPKTPTGPPPEYACLMNIPSIKLGMGPKPDDPEVLRNFLGLKTPLNMESARRLACSASKEGFTPLHEAARQGRVREVSALIRLGASADARDHLGYSAVHKAAAAGSVQVLRVLKEVGADLEAVGNQGYRPIHRAAMNGGMEAVRWLVEQGCNVDAVAQGGWTALHLAVWWDREPVVRCLRDLGANVQLVTSIGRTPVGVAITCGHNHLVEHLINCHGRSREQMGKLYPQLQITNTIQ